MKSKRSARKKRRVILETYTHPVVFRDVLPLIARHCSMQTFARLKRVCKRFWEWLPEHHPLRTEIVEEYAKERPRERPEVVNVLLNAYYRRFMNMIHPRLHYRVLTRLIRGSGTEDDGYIRCDLHTGVIYIREGAISHVFADNPCAMLEFKGNMEVSCKEIVCGGFEVFKYTANPGLERLVFRYADDAIFMSTYLPVRGLK